MRLSGPLHMLEAMRNHRLHRLFSLPYGGHARYAYCCEIPGLLRSNNQDTAMQRQATRAVHLYI